MIKIGTLVRYKEDRDIGIVTEIFKDCVGEYFYWVVWSDGFEGECLDTEFEVLV